MSSSFRSAIMMPASRRSSFDALSAEILGRRYAHAWLLTEGLAPPDLHDFALAPGLLNDEVDRPWYSRFFGMITCAT
jgi:hypothetical protein